MAITKDDETTSIKDTEMSQEQEDGLSQERIARNIALHLAISANNYEETETLLNGDGDGEEGADAWWEDENHLRWNALHFAVQTNNSKLVSLILQKGGIWNSIDELGLTPADYAYSLNFENIYKILFEEGVRQTLILNLLDRDSHAQSSSRMSENKKSNDDGKSNLQTDDNGKNATIRLQVTESIEEVSADNDKFLQSKLTFVKDQEGKMRCVDPDGGLVMAAWETDVMQKTVKLLCFDEKTGKQKEGLKILNIGFGLGIIDEFFQKTNPLKHVIVEAHPDSIQFAKQNGWQTRKGVELIHSKWENCLDDLISNHGPFDVIYWDTYAQNYSQLRDFFEEVPFLLNQSNPQAKFSFFHGLAGTNKFLYDVYTRVSELDLREFGLDTQWTQIRPSTTTETWNGILRKYWDLDVLNIPISKRIEEDVSE